MAQIERKSNWRFHRPIVLAAYHLFPQLASWIQEQGKASAKSSQTWAPWPERERFGANGTPCAADGHNGAGAGLPIGVIEGKRQQIAGLFRQHGVQADNIPALCISPGQVAVDGCIVQWLVPRCGRTVIVYRVRIMT